VNAYIGGEGHNLQEYSGVELELTKAKGCG
jgi:ribosomal protein S12